MLSKCANPACSGIFRYLHEGRIFHLITDSEEALAIHSATAIERFWLCEECSKKLTLVSHIANGLPGVQVKAITCEDDFVPGWNGEPGRLTEEHRVFAATLPVRRLL
jgi:hypothetical protein